MKALRIVLVALVGLAAAAVGAMGAISIIPAQTSTDWDCWGDARFFPCQPSRAPSPAGLLRFRQKFLTRPFQR